MRLAGTLLALALGVVTGIACEWHRIREARREQLAATAQQIRLVRSCRDAVPSDNDVAIRELSLLLAILWSKYDELADEKP